jgi:putative MATE family efflux protein
MIAVFGFIQLAMIGTLTLVARRSGAGNIDGASRAARQGLIWAGVLSIGTALPGLYLRRFIPGVMGMAPEVARDADAYLRVLFLGLPALFFMPTVEAIFRARGDARTPLVLQILAVATNIAGNAIAVFVLKAGVTGIAGATIVSRLVGSAAGFWLLARGTVGLDLRRHSGPLLDVALWLKIARVSAPVGLRTMLFGIIYQVIMGITATYGASVQNGLGVGIRMESICFFVLVGFGIAAGPIVGQNLGAGRPDRAARGAWTAAGMAAAVALLFSIFYRLKPELLLNLFASDAGTIANGAEYLRIISFCLMFTALEVVFAHSFTGAGDTIPPMLIDVPLTAARIPLSYWMAYDLGWGSHGIWWAICITAIGRGVFMALWFLRGRWKRHRPDLD